MRATFNVSRRKAAIFIAGALAASSGPAVATSVRSAVTLPEPDVPAGAVRDAHRLVESALRSVRQARGGRQRTEAFERCKAAFRSHDLSEAAVVASLDAGRAARRGGSTLYRTVDSSSVLTSVIVRELDGWPKTDAGWIERFGDLEVAFRAHVNEYVPRDVRTKRSAARVASSSVRKHGDGASAPLA